MLTIFTGVPKGTSVRRLDTGRKAPGQDSPYNWTAWDDTGRAYGNSIRDALKKLKKEPTVHIHKG